MSIIWGCVEQCLMTNPQNRDMHIQGAIEHRLNRVKCNSERPNKLGIDAS